MPNRGTHQEPTHRGTNQRTETRTKQAANRDVQSEERSMEDEKDLSSAGGGSENEGEVKVESLLDTSDIPGGEVEAEYVEGGEGDLEGASASGGDGQAGGQRGSQGQRGAKQERDNPGDGRSREQGGSSEQTRQKR
jgi:hypothetical protein